MLDGGDQKYTRNQELLSKAIAADNPAGLVEDSFTYGLIDTGSLHSPIGAEAAQDMQGALRSNLNDQLTAANGSAMRTDGIFYTTSRSGTFRTKHKLKLSPDLPSKCTAGSGFLRVTHNTTNLMASPLEVLAYTIPL
ncbi:hypothetical protein FGIG_12332 [Fasciola gigantica]|uniref:Uncharacterized protein n=1 Tax=Fasciola gigantica TaxID=46835 RepID=A0A504YSH8_FASGI|nr:hypothetical protein FGIG_12332 [Fasciola gigantica]